MKLAAPPHMMEWQQALEQPGDRQGGNLLDQQRDLLGPQRPAWAGPGHISPFGMLKDPMYLPLSQACLNATQRGEAGLESGLFS